MSPAAPNINFYHNILKGYTFYYELPKKHILEVLEFSSVMIFLISNVKNLKYQRVMQIALKIFGMKLPKMAKNMLLVV